MGALQDEIRRKFQLYPAAHMTHIDNLPAIVAAGELRSYNSMRGHAYFNLANDDVQSGRAAITVPETGRALHDYVPLYFGFKTPMVAVNQRHNESLIFLRFSLDVLGISGAVISDGNARSGKTRFQLFTKVDDLSLLDAKAVQTVKYAHDKELARRKQAEVLVPDRLPLSWLQDVVCSCRSTAVRVVDILQKSGTKRSVLVNEGWYFGPTDPRG